MNDVSVITDGRPIPLDASPAEQLLVALENHLRHAILGVRLDIRVYESLRSISEVIGGEYGDRVIFELIQNAHDAHGPADSGRILVKLVIRNDDRGDLYVANGGQGFTWANVDALRNIGLSSKSIGEGIGNKGLGFRSVEVLTDDPRIYSQPTAIRSQKFDGYCFRFASQREISRRAAELSDPETAKTVGETFPTYLGMVPLTSQDSTIRDFAAQGFATCVHLPLKDIRALVP